MLLLSKKKLLKKKIENYNTKSREQPQPKPLHLGPMRRQSLPRKFHNQPSYQIEDIEEYSNFDTWDEANLA